MYFNLPPIGHTKNKDFTVQFRKLEHVLLTGRQIHAVLCFFISLKRQDFLCNFQFAAIRDCEK